MTKEEKQLLLKDLCGRLPYNIIVECSIESGESIDLILNTSHIDELVDDSLIIKPYLRSMSSMTKEEKKEYESFFSIGEYSCGGSLYGKEYEYIADSPDDISQSICLFDWLLAHHFDYRGLIEMGLALKAPEDMYKIE